MEKIPSLLCPGCGNLYGIETCGHIYCESCSVDKTCQYCEAHEMGTCICDMSKKIKKGLSELKNDLEYEKEDFLEKQIEKILNGSNCSNCCKSTGTALICASCVKEVKLKKLEDEQWIIQEVRGNVKISDGFICPECAVTGHGGHKLVEVSGIRNLTDAIKNEFFLEYYHCRKAILDQFDLKLERRQTLIKIYYDEFNERNNEEYFATCSDQLINWYKEERKKLTDGTLKILKLILREAKMYIDLLEKHIDHQLDLFEEAATDEKKQEIERLIIRLNILKFKFEEFIEAYPDVQLTPGDVIEIDTEANARMETLEENYVNGLMIRIDLEEGSKFHKYQAILKEREEINAYYESYESKPIDSTENDFIDKCNQKIISMKTQPYFHFEEAYSLKFYYMEIMEAEIRKDRKEMEMMEYVERNLFMDLMKLKFFPKIPGGNPMDAVFNRFFEF